MSETGNVREVFILGSGRSIGDLSVEEKSYINSAACRIALNKFMAFHDVCGILPTHVFFLDNYDASSRRFLQHIFDVCREQGLRGITFVVNRDLRGRMSSSRVGYFWKRVLKSRYARLLGVGRRGHLFLSAPGCRYEFAINRDYFGKDPWASTLDEPLFHHRGSLTSVLNYVAIRYPGATIKLLGVDLNRSGYFFQSQLEDLPLEWEDFSTPIGTAANQHFSLVPHEGTTMLDRFDYVVTCLERTNNRVVSCYADSELVTRGFVEYEPVTGDGDVRAAEGETAVLASQ